MLVEPQALGLVSPIGIVGELVLSLRVYVWASGPPNEGEEERNGTDPPTQAFRAHKSQRNWFCLRCPPLSGEQRVALGLRLAWTPILVIGPHAIDVTRFPSSCTPCGVSGEANAAARADTRVILMASLHLTMTCRPK